MTTSEYHINEVESCPAYGQIALEYFLEHADSATLTVAPYQEVGIGPMKLAFSLFRSPKIKESRLSPRIKNLLEKLRPDLIKAETNNMRWNCVQPLGKEFTHYTYRLSRQLKDLLLEAGIFNEAYLEDSPLCGLEDPVFFKNDASIGYVIAHEGMISIWLTQQQKKAMELRGVIFWE